MKTKTVILFGLLALVVAIGMFTTGCGSNEKETVTDPMIKEIVVNPIQVETIEVETITWENVDVESWD